MSEDKAVEQPVDLTPEQIKAREADVAADVAKRNAKGAKPESSPLEERKPKDGRIVEREIPAGTQVGGIKE
jgi:hypothetical protein